MLLSIVVPVYNEAEVLPLFARELTPVLESIGWAWEIVFVNDGSRDRTAEILSHLAAEEPRIKVVEFSRNFGHQPAVTAGLDLAAGDAVVVMDADLQDPPELLPRMLELYLEGYDIVSPRREEREGETFFKRASAGFFYWLMRKAVDERLPSQVSDFRLFSRRAVEAMRNFREQHRFMRGMVAWLGLPEAFLPFRRPARAAGETKYPLHKMVRFAWTAIASFSALPLRICVTGGTLLALFGGIYLLKTLFEALVLKITVPGWPSVVALQTVFSGATLTAIGLVGDYVARIYEESKGRPLYVVSRCLNLEPREVPRAAILTGRQRRLQVEV